MENVGQVLRLVYCRSKLKDVKNNLNCLGIKICDELDTYMLLHNIHIVYNYVGDPSVQEEILRVIIGDDKDNIKTLKEILKNWN